MQIIWRRMATVFCFYNIHKIQQNRPQISRNWSINSDYYRPTTSILLPTLECISNRQTFVSRLVRVLHEFGKLDCRAWSNLRRVSCTPIEKFPRNFAYVYLRIWLATNAQFAGRLMQNDGRKLETRRCSCT